MAFIVTTFLLSYINVAMRAQNRLPHNNGVTIYL